MEWQKIEAKEKDGTLVKTSMDYVGETKDELFGFIPAGYIGRSFVTNADSSGDNIGKELYINGDLRAIEFDDKDIPVFIFKSNGDYTAEELITGKTFIIGNDYGIVDAELKDLWFYNEEIKMVNFKSEEQANYLAYKEIRKNPLTLMEGDYFEVDEAFKALYFETLKHKDEIKSMIETAEEEAIKKCDDEMKESIDRNHEIALVENFIKSKTK